MTRPNTRRPAFGCEFLWEVIEQIDLGSGQTTTTHVFGLGIDDEVGYRIESASPKEDIWTHRDDLGSLTSITDDSGVVVERYEYGDYGLVTIMDENGVVRLSSMYNAFHLYTGRPLIPGTGLYDYRYRVMDPVTGRFAQRDPLGYIDSMNMYSYAIGSPYTFIDPYGLSSSSNSRKKGGGGTTPPGLISPKGPNGECTAVRVRIPMGTPITRGLAWLAVAQNPTLGPLYSMYYQEEIVFSGGEHTGFGKNALKMINMCSMVVI